MRRTLSLSPVVLSLLACSSPEGPVPDEGGSLHAVVHTASVREFEGDALYDLSPEIRRTPVLPRMQLTSSGRGKSTGTRLSMVRLGGEVPAPGTHVFEPIDTSRPGAVGLVAYFGESEADERLSYVSTGGELTVTKVGEDEFQATFHIEARLRCRYSPEQGVRCIPYDSLGDAPSIVITGEMNAKRYVSGGATPLPLLP